MYILGIETATRTGGVAIVSEDGVLAEYTLNIEVTHSERLMSTVDRVFKDTGLRMASIDGFGVSIGPGSFTGLRIGLSTVKGLAFTTGKPVAAVPTLKALAWNTPHARYPVCPLLDARKKEVYAALYHYDGRELVQDLPETVLPLAELAERVAGEVLFTGEGARLFAGDIERFFAGRAHLAPRSASVPSAASIAEIALDMISVGRQTGPDGLSPMYIRRPEAELAWEKRERSR
ncbi:MAG: tRNA (adenosine(37)-N6)-threonylcarbamoyltransferase complex dimerization subunit type 1 TsaB [Nitrospirae bacterium]|nr:tRNA (adenosine(37)-N6)-threonylcarbamoyltransferase complex dimerization subunit type 1 TsaB [Nitrospirota bacterium]NTW66090.1 tRNA (adenosine(37)-N6)-threonylcarbamoyltransferase complex dimerization subunit type 1 TsaB [Nitrospirota bacterium]